MASAAVPAAVDLDIASAHQLHDRRPAVRVAVDDQQFPHPAAGKRLQSGQRRIERRLRGRLPEKRQCSECAAALLVIHLRDDLDGNVSEARVALEPVKDQPAVTVRQSQIERRSPLASHGEPRRAPRRAVVAVMTLKPCSRAETISVRAESFVLIHDQ